MLVHVIEKLKVRFLLDAIDKNVENYGLTVQDMNEQKRAQRTTRGILKHALVEKWLATTLIGGAPFIIHASLYFEIMVVSAYFIRHHYALSGGIVFICTPLNGGKKLYFFRDYWFEESIS